MEDPDTGDDLGGSGGFSWHDAVPDEVAASFSRAQRDGTYDARQGGNYYWDGDEDLWWTFDTADAVAAKFPQIVTQRKLGGVFAWGLGEDAPLFEHLDAVNRALDAAGGGGLDDAKSEL